MFGRFFTLIVGFYGGIYIDQNYDVPKIFSSKDKSSSSMLDRDYWVSDPKEIMNKVQKFLENHRRDK